MTKKPSLRDFLWMSSGAIALLGFVLLVMHFHKVEDRLAQLAGKAQRVDLVGQMQADLVAASEAEKSAVLAVTDQDSQLLADQARAASAKVELERSALGELLATAGTPGERELLAQFTAAFAAFQKIDNDLLALAVKNTNLKAYALAYGPAAVALQEMNAALTRFVTAHADAPEATATLRLAFGAQVSALRLQTLLPPHIAEENEAKEDELEALMATEDAQVRKNLADLAALPTYSHAPELATATARYAEFSTLKAQILALSRENTNVRSLSLSLNQKRKAMLLCQATLNALQQALLAEPIAGVTYGLPVRPRGL